MDDIPSYRAKFYRAYMDKERLTYIENVRKNYEYKGLPPKICDIDDYFTFAHARRLRCKLVCGKIDAFVMVQNQCVGKNLRG